MIDGTIASEALRNRLRRPPKAKRLAELFFWCSSLNLAWIIMNESDFLRESDRGNVWISNILIAANEESRGHHGELESFGKGNFL